MSWRPRNESKLDVERESAAAARMSAWCGADYSKLGEIQYGLDFAFYKGPWNELVAVAEYKHRAARYETLLLSLEKWHKGVLLAETARIKFFIFVEWPDGLYYYAVPPRRELLMREKGFLVAKGGNSRGQPGDVEPVIHIPGDLFRPVPQ